MVLVAAFHTLGIFMMKFTMSSLEEIFDLYFTLKGGYHEASVSIYLMVSL